MHLLFYLLGSTTKRNDEKHGWQTGRSTIRRADSARDASSVGETQQPARTAGGELAERERETTKKFVGEVG